MVFLTLFAVLPRMVDSLGYHLSGIFVAMCGTPAHFGQLRISSEEHLFSLFAVLPRILDSSGYHLRAIWSLFAVLPRIFDSLGYHRRAFLSLFAVLPRILVRSEYHLRCRFVAFCGTPANSGQVKISSEGHICCDLLYSRAFWTA